MAAERDTVDRLIAHYLADRVGASFHGRISGVTRSGLFVKLDETGADGFIPIRTLGNEYYIYDETRHALVGSRSGPCTGLATASRFGWSKRLPWPARCASRYYLKVGT